VTYEDAVRLVLRQARAWMTKDLAAIATDFDEDGVFVSPGGRWVGPEAIRAAAVAFFADVERVDVRVVSVVACGAAGAAEWTWDETRRDGTRTVAEDGIVFATRDGRITYWREYF